VHASVFAYGEIMLSSRAIDELPTITGLFDPGWWDRMRDSTTSGHFSPEATLLTVAVFSLAFLAIAAGFLIKIRLGGKEAGPSAWIVRPEEIRALIEAAMSQRSKVRVSFVRDDPGARSTDASILAADPERGIELEMTALVRATPSWVGKLVVCDFRLRLDPRKDYQSFYSFVAPIGAVRKAGDDFVHMHVGWPDRLELEQKRGFLRVEPPRGFVLELSLWHENTIRAAKGNFALPSTWGPPLLRYAPGENLHDAQLRNVSGGGVCLEVQAETLREHPSFYEPANRFLMRLLLAEPEADQPVEFFLALRLQNSYGDPGISGKKGFGFHILSFGVPTEAPRENLSWKTAAAGVPSLDDWAFRRHLALYRSRGE
jgi:hypothetical protein